MLIINNGVPKSGSTWVQRILEKGLNPAYPDKKWRNSWKNPSIDPTDLKAYVESGEWKGEQPVLIKMHITYGPEYDFIFQEGIKTVVSYRNIPDSVVSWFHHQVRHEKTTLERRKPWCNSTGRQFALRAVAHRLSWAGKPNVLPMKYEEMISNAPQQISRLFNGLELPLSEAKYEEIARETQVKLSTGEAPRDGMHVRTAGRSTAHEELPPHIFKELTELQNSLPDLSEPAESTSVVQVGAA